MILPVNAHFYIFHPISTVPKTFHRDACILENAVAPFEKHRHHPQGGKRIRTSWLKKKQSIIHIIWDWVWKWYSVYSASYGENTEWQTLIIKVDSDKKKDALSCAHSLCKWLSSTVLCCLRTLICKFTLETRQGIGINLALIMRCITDWALNNESIWNWRYVRNVCVFFYKKTKASINCLHSIPVQCTRNSWDFINT